MKTINKLTNKLVFAFSTLIFSPFTFAHADSSAHIHPLTIAGIIAICSLIILSVIIIKMSLASLKNSKDQISS